MRLLLILIIIYLVMQNPTLKSKVMNFVNNINHSVGDKTGSIKEAVNGIADKASS